MSSKLSVSLILPAYNEVKTIAQVIQEAKDYFERRGGAYEILVCADGNDGTRELAEKMAKSNSHLKVTGHPGRCGKGRGIREGMKMAQGEIIGFSDADNKTPIDEFEKMEPWLTEGYEMVIGSRALQDSRILRAQPLHRRLGSVGFSLFMHAVLGMREIVDTQCGFKFFKRHAALDLFSRQRIDGYMFDPEILYLAHLLGYSIKQVPVRWKDDGDSRFHCLSGGIRDAIDIFRIRFNHPRLKSST